MHIFIYRKLNYTLSILDLFAARMVNFRMVELSEQLNYIS